MKARYVKWSDKQGESHYWLVGEHGVLDMNFAGRETPYEGYADYRAGKPTKTMGFHPWKEDPAYPNNKDARAIMDRVWANLERRA